MNRVLKIVFSSLLFLIVNGMLYGQITPESTKIAGKWLSANGNYVVEIYPDREHAEFRGRIIQIRNAPNGGSTLTDVNNPDESLRKKPLIGMDILSGLEYDGDSRWSGGELYHPRTGKSFSCKFKMLDINRLESTAYIGFSFIGKTRVWTRYKG